MLKKLFNKNKDGNNSPSGITLPDFSRIDGNSNQEATVGKWLVKVGDYVNKGNIIAEISTSNFDLELEVYESGHILFIENTPDKILYPGDLLAIVGNQGDTITHLLEENNQPFYTEEEGQIMEGCLGEVKLFAGSFIPENWSLCDGKELLIDEHPDLYKVLKNKYGGTENHTFKLPLIDIPFQLNYIICTDGFMPK